MIRMFRVGGENGGRRLPPPGLRCGNAFLQSRSEKCGHGMARTGARLLVVAISAFLCGGAAARVQEEGAPRVAEETVPAARLFVIIYQPGPAWAKGVPMREQGLLDHFYYMRDLHGNGRVLLAGPLGEEGGLVVVKAMKKEEVDEIVRSDPAVIEGKFVGVVHHYVPRFGGIVQE